ncbi:MAG TPA: DNRLRE domain-containing protein, partial [Rariglobus sp.]
MNTHTPSKTTLIQNLRHRAPVASAALAVCLIPFALSSGRSATIYGLSDDRQVNASGTLSDVSTMMSGYSGGTGINPVFVFQLPALPAGKEFDAASLRFYNQAKTGMPVFNADLYALGVAGSASVLSTDFYAGASDATALLVKDNVLTPAASSGQVTTSETVLTDFLNAAYDNGSGAGKYVFFRLSPDVAGLTGNYTRYNVYSAEAPGGAYYYPALIYNTVDAILGWTTVPLGGGGFVTGLVADASGSDIYCRTDVGGVLRWAEPAGKWISVTDTIVPTSTTSAATLMSTLAMAVDPADANKLYVAVGSTDMPGLKGIYASADKGATWSAINSTFIIDGNGAFRSYGERLAVDPNNPNILWFGSNQQGLQKGVKSGATWTWTQIPSTSVPFGTVASGDKAGVTFVACDPNGGSTIVYAGVYDSVGTTGGVYCSTDNGTTWTKVGGTAIATPRRGQVAANGTLYVTGYQVVGRMLRGGSLAAITPAASVDYRGIAVDPTNTAGDTLYVSEATTSAASRIWRTTSGGASWLTQGTSAFNNSGTIYRQEPDGTSTLTGDWFRNTSSLLVNPSNPSELWAADYFGVARSQNAQLMGGGSGNQPIWYMLQKEQEETVVEALKNGPSGPRLMTAMADVGGYRYNTLSARPYGTDGSKFRTPANACTTSLDFCETDTNVWARGYYGDYSNGTGAVSRDGGLTWLHFGEIARKTIASGATGLETWDITTFLAAQKARGATLVTLVLASDNAANATNNFVTAPVAFDSREAADSALHPRLIVNGSTSLVAVADTYISGATAALDTNYGNATALNVAHAYTTNTTNERHTYLKFDLSGVSSVSSATLQLSRRAATAGVTYTVGVFACSNVNWIEGDGGTDNLPADELTWNRNIRLNASGSGRPFGVPDYKSAAGTMLRGGRVALSSTESNRMVWMPFGTSTMPHYSDDRGATWTPCVGLPSGINRLAAKSNPSYLLTQVAADRANGQFYMTQLSSGSGHHTV